MALIDYILNAEDADVLTTEGGDPILAFQVNNEPLTYGFAVDWNGDSYLDDVNESERVLKWSTSRGRERIFNPSGNGFNPYEIGRLTVTLDNHDGRYNPWNTESPLYGYIMPGRNMQFKVAVYSSTSTFEHDSYFVFTGTVTDIQMNGHNKTVNFICEDGWRYLADNIFVKMPYGVNYSGTAGELHHPVNWDLVFDTNELKYEYRKHSKWPWGIDYYFPFTWDTIPRHWWWNGTTKGAIEMITFGSLGRSWINANGAIDFAEVTESTDAAVATLDEDYLLDDVYLPMPWENLRSEVILRGSNNLWWGRRKTLGTLREPMKIDAGATVEFSIPIKNDEIDNCICTEVESITVEAFANADGTGTNISAAIDDSLTYDTRNFHIKATNRGATSGYITTYTITGDPVTIAETEWRYESTGYYRYSSFLLDNPWLSITAIGSTNNYVTPTTTTYNDEDRINTVGNTLIDYLSIPRYYPVVKMRGRYQEQFQLELEDKVTLTMPTLQVDDDFRISKIAHQSMTTTQDILTTLWLYPVMTASTD